MSDKRPLLSIIIPVFNNELYIKQTLTSVFAQIDNDVEVIIINDGSTDNSAAPFRRQLMSIKVLATFTLLASKMLEYP